MTDHLTTPHGGVLVNPLVDDARGEALKAGSRDWPSWDLTPVQLCDIELLANGGFSPLAGFMKRADYESVCSQMRLASGLLWPIPVTLDVPDGVARDLKRGSMLTLRDPEGVMLAALHVEQVWKPDREAEAEVVFATTSRRHPGVARLLDQTHPYYVGGRIEVLQLPVHYDYRALRLTPAEIRKEFQRLGWRRVVAFQTRDPMHRAEQELTLRTANEVGANILIQPVVGLTRPDDLDHYTRTRCYQAILPTYPPGMAKLSLLPLAMRMAGPREALWHAIIRKNYGCSHFIVERNHASPGEDAAGTPFYAPNEAQRLLQLHQEELGVTMAPSGKMIYVEDLDRYLPESEVLAGTRTLNMSAAQLGARLAEGREIPSWLTFPGVAAELRKRHPPRRQQGCTIFFTGLSGSGKSTIANVLLVKFLEMGGRPVTLLDGDLVRKHLSSELGFSKEHRDINIRRIGYVASEITKNGGLALCAPIAPYEGVREEVRGMIAPLGGFVLVYLATPLEVCEARDRKGLYAKARAGIIKEFTGISDPYEPPAAPDLVIDTTGVSPEEAVQQILLYMERAGLVGANHG